MAQSQSAHKAFYAYPFLARIVDYGQCIATGFWQTLENYRSNSAGTDPHPFVDKEEIGREGKNTTSIVTLPPELISQIIFIAVQSQKRADDHTGAAARQLLSLSHVSSYFRKIAISNPRLWSTIVFINDISARSLFIILARSRPFSFDLTILDDGTIPLTVQNQVIDNFHRVTALSIRVKEGYSGIFARRLIMVAAPSLERCHLNFRGARNVKLGMFPPNLILPFDNQAPRLREFRFTNCFIPSAVLASLPSLICVTMEHDGGRHQEHGESDTFLSVPEVQICLLDLSLLRQLHISHCIKLTSAFLEHTVYLPSLQQFDLSASAEVCQDLSLVLRFPSTCSTRVTIGFPTREPMPAGYTMFVAQAVSKFVTPDHDFTDCAFLWEDRRYPSLRLIQRRTSLTLIEFRFDIEGLGAQSPRYILLLIQFSALLVRPFHDMAVSDFFMYRLWTSLAVTLKGALEKPFVLHLYFGGRSLAPYIVQPVVRSLTNVHTAKVHCTDAWRNPGLGDLLTRNASSLRNLTVSLGNQAMDPDAFDNLKRFVESRSELGSLAFGFTSSYIADLGWAAHEEIASVVGSFAKDIPDTIALRWETLD